MKKTLIYALAASVAVLASCAKEATVKEAPAKETVPLTITFGVDTTKSYINYEGHTFWTPNDLISVFSDQGTRKVFITTTEDGATTKDFTCEDWIAGETPEWAVFCYEEKATPLKTYDVALTADGVFSANVSEFQPITISHNYGSFGSKANISVAEITNNQGTYSGQMKNALGLVKITIPTGVENISEIILEDADGTAPIAGKVSIDCTKDNPVCTPVGGQGKSRISAKWAKTGSFAAGKPIFFCVIPSVSFTPKFTFVKTDGSKASVTGNKAISVSRNKYFDCGTPSSLDFVPEGYTKEVVSVDFSVKDPSDASKYLWPFKETYVTISNQKKDSGKIVTYTIDNTPHSFAFARGTTAQTTTSGTSVSSYDWKNTYGDIRLSSYSDGTEYFQVNCPSGYIVANVSVYITNSGAVPASVTDISDQETVWTGNIPKASNISVDLTGSTSAKNGCKIHFTKVKQQYKLQKFIITYFIPEETE